MRHLTVLLLTLAAPSLRAQASSFPSLIYATVQVAGTPRNLLLDLQVPAGAGPFPVEVAGRVARDCLFPPPRPDSWPAAMR